MTAKNEVNSTVENTETLRKPTGDFDFHTPIAEFIEAGLKGNLSRFKNKVSSENWNDFMKYLKSPQSSYSHNVIKAFEEGKADKYLGVLNTQILSKTAPIHDMLSKLSSLYKKEYNLDREEEKILQNEINTLTLGELSRIYYSQAKRKDLLKSVLKVKTQEMDEKMNELTKKEENILEDIFGEQSSFYQKLIQPENRKLAESIFAIHNMNSHVTLEHLQYIFSAIDNTEDKIALIQYFIPNISLKKAESLGLIHASQVEDELIEIAKKYNIPQDLEEEFIQNIDTSLLFIETATLDFHSFDFSTASDSLLESIAQEMNASKVSETTILGKKDFENRCKDSGLDLTGFEIGNILKIKIPENIKTKTKESVQFFYIKDISLLGVELVNVTKRNGISSVVNNPDTIPKENIKYSTFQELFQTLGTLGDSQGYEYSFEEVPNLKNEKGEKIDTIPQTHEVSNVKQLEQALNEIDPQGYSGDIKKMAFKFKKGAQDNSPYDENFFFVTDAGEDFIKLNSGEIFRGERLTSFIDRFEEMKCTRFKKLDTVDEFLSEMQLLGDSFKDIIFEEGKFISKDHKGNHHAPEVNLLVGKNQDKDGSIHIDKVENGVISFTTGEYKEGNKSKNEPNTFKGESVAKNLSYTEFFMYVKNKNFTAQKQPVEEHHDEHHDDHHGAHMHQHRSLFTMWMGFYSISEVSHGLHQLIHAVEHSFETGNKLKAAKAALFFGKVLPLHIRVELQSEVENSEKETMEKIKKEMLGVDWKDMWPMVEHVLENDSAPQYEVEAAMFAVMKYGSLYPKDLAKYRGQYIWFKKLGGHESMIPILTKSALENDPNLVVTEEVLVNALLAMQAKGVPGYLPKRRSKIHKEFGKTIVEGVNNEMGDGEREAGMRMTTDGRIDYLMNEFKGSTFAHGVGGMKEVWKTGPTPAWKMNTLPFVIMTSGISLNMHQKLIKELVGYGYTTPYGSLQYCSSKAGVEFYQKYVGRVIALKYGANSDAYKKYKAIQHPSKGTSQEAAYKFWQEYGSELYPVINMNDGFVVSKMHDEGNEALKKYYNDFENLHKSDDFSATEDQIESGAYDQDVSGIAVTGALLSKIKLGDGGTFVNKSAKKVLNMHMNAMTEIANNASLKEEQKYDVFRNMYEKLERDVFGKIQPFIRRGGVDGYKDYQIVVAMRKAGFEVFPKEVHDDNQEEKAEYELFIKNVYENVKNKAHHDEEEVPHFQQNVQHSIDDILEKAAANDENMKLAA